MSVYQRCVEHLEGSWGNGFHLAACSSLLGWVNLMHDLCQQTNCMTGAWFCAHEVGKHSSTKTSYGTLLIPMEKYSSRA